MQTGRYLALVLLTACGGPPEGTDAPTDDFDRHGMLRHLATNVLLPIQADVATTAAALPGAIDAYCDALDAGQPGATLDSARGAWRTTMDSWERAEAVLVGPAAMDFRTLRDRIYGWPLLDPCGIDRGTASSWTDPSSYDVTVKLANVRTLAAVEFLLFTSGTAHNCATTPIGWDSMGADLPRARCRQAQMIATDVAAQAVAVHDGWRADGGGYVTELAEAGTSSSSIPSAQEGVNRISDGLFYVDKMVKDMKLGEAAGITINACGTVGMPCDREVELRFADRGTFAIRTNLITLRQAFTGTTLTSDGPGFDDFLRALGQSELADRMTTNLDGAIAKANALPDSFRTALTTDYAKVVATHAAISSFTDDMKSQFLTVLSLEIPDDVAADND